MGADLNRTDWNGQQKLPGVAVSPVDLAQLTAQTHGKYAARNLQGGTWILSASAVTLAAGNVVNSTTPIVGFFNPAGNTFRGMVTRIYQATRSGTPGGPLVLGYGKNVAITSIGTAAAVNLKTFATGNPGGMYTFVNAASTGMAAPTYLRTIGGPAAVAAGAGVYSAIEETAGAPSIEPGNFLGVYATAAGTTHIVDVAIEIEVVSV